MSYWVGNIVVVAIFVLFIFLAYKGVRIHAKSYFQKFLCFYLLLSVLLWLCIFSTECDLTNICTIKRIGIEMKLKLMNQYFDKKTFGIRSGCK